MVAKEILFNDNARKQIAIGLHELANAVKALITERTVGERDVGMRDETGGMGSP